MKKYRLFDYINEFIFILIAFISIFPIYLIVANAFSTEADIVNHGYAIVPLNPTFNAFKFVLKDFTPILKAFGVSIIYSVGNSFLTVAVNAMLAYSMSRSHFALKKFCTVFLLITMFFSAGLIPTYIINTQVYGLDDSVFIYLIPGISGFSVFMLRSFFNQVPASLTESAQIDGATDMQMLIKIVAPLSIPFLVTQFFMNVVGLWKNYTTTLYYIQDRNLYTLEYYIQLILKDASVMKENLLQLGLDSASIPTETMRFAVVMFTLIPMLVVFPLVQKYMSKGLMVGAVKG